MHCKPPRPLAAALLLSGLLAGCVAGPSGDFPSLAVRDAERLAGTLRPVQPYVAPPPGPATLQQLGALESEAGEAHAAFLAEASRASSIVEAARGADSGSEAWARAEVALASLAAARSRTMVPLADLDGLHVAAAVEGQSLDSIAAARDAAEAQVAAEDAAIARLKDVLDR